MDPLEAEKKSTKAPADEYEDCAGPGGGIKLDGLKQGRGSLDNAAVWQAVVDNWDDLQEQFEEKEEAEKEEMKEHFNEFIDGEDDLGDVLFEDAETFD